MAKQTEVSTKETLIGGKKYHRERATKDFFTIGEGQNFIGYVGEQKTLVTKNYPDGLPYLEMTLPETGEIQNIWLNGGLRGKLTMAQVKPGELIEIVGLGKKEFELEDGSPAMVNDYEIFRLKN